MINGFHEEKGDTAFKFASIILAMMALFVICMYVVIQVDSNSRTLDTKLKTTGIRRGLKAFMSSYSYEYEKSMLYLIFIELYRYDSSFFPSAPITNNNIVEKIQKQMETNYSYPYTLDRLAKENNMSKSYLSHLFKSVTGYGVIEYLLKPVSGQELRNIVEAILKT